MSSFPINTTLVGPKTAQGLRDWLDAPWPELVLPTQKQVETLISRLSLATNGRPPSQAEAGEKIDLFWRVLRRVPLIDLRRGFDDLIKYERFMPGTSAVYAACAKYTRRREFTRSRARLLILRHEREWVAPVEQVTGEEVSAILADLPQRFPSQREAV